MSQKPEMRRRRFCGKVGKCLKFLPFLFFSFSTCYPQRRQFLYYSNRQLCLSAFKMFIYAKSKDLFDYVSNLALRERERERERVTSVLQWLLLLSFRLLDLVWWESIWHWRQKKEKRKMSADAKIKTFCVAQQAYLMKMCIVN